MPYLTALSAAEIDIELNEITMNFKDLEGNDHSPV
jgi:hypothetical protein